MTFLIILGITEICRFRLVIEGKTGKEIPDWSRLEFLGKFSANNFALSDAEENNFGLWNRGGIADLSLLRTLLVICQKSWEPGFWEMMDSFVLLAYASLTASRTLLQWLLASLNFTLDLENLFCWCKQKKVISMNYDSSTRSWKPWRWVSFDLILMMRDIYIIFSLNPLTKFTSSRST